MHVKNLVSPLQVFLVKGYHEYEHVKIIIPKK